MSRTARLTNALRNRRNAVALAGAVAALAGGSASAALLAPAHSTPTAHAATVRTPVARTDQKTSQHAVGEHQANARVDAVKRNAKRPVAARTDARTVAVRHAAPSAPTRPYTIVDSVTPSALPANHVVATYATGGYAVPASQVTGKHVVWIDTNGSDPHANALDVEPGDATPAQAATWASAHLKAAPRSPAIIYTMRSDWPAAQQAVSSLPHWMQHQVRWWIADPTGVPHIVPGSSATQWYWGSNVDLSMAAPNFQK